MKIAQGYLATFDHKVATLPNLTGDYVWPASQRRQKAKFRPLRSYPMAYNVFYNPFRDRTPDGPVRGKAVGSAGGDALGARLEIRATFFILARDLQIICCFLS
jgi:hypothetical protein